ncbi:MAG: citrate/2-methylcitrate synthase, partial [Pseudomonadales bacterium]
MAYAKGLEGVVAGETAISHVEGDIGRLSYRGYAIEELVKQDYATVMWLVLFGELPTAAEKADLEGFLATHGEILKAETRVLEVMPTGLHPMRMLQSVIPLLQLDPEVSFRSLDEEAVQGLQIVARMPSLIAAFHRITTTGSLPAFDADMEYLENFLTMFTGQEAMPEHVDILKVVQILQMEHSFNAGTFTGRVVASTLAPVDAVFSSAVGALFGILHGGADEAALNDAKTVARPEAAAAFIDDLLARKGKLMGMGHREYRKVDPRALILKPLAVQLCTGTPYQNHFDTLVALETAFNQAMQAKGKEVWANLEFYKGAVYEAIGIPSRYFTSVFALSRVIGWLAHFMES